MALGSAARSYPSTKQALRAKTGGKGIRTPGLLIANETLYQLSYTPILRMKTDPDYSGKIPSVHRFYQPLNRFANVPILRCNFLASRENKPSCRRAGRRII